MSRTITDLIPELQPLAQRFLSDAKAAGYDVIIDQTLRTYAEQDALYAQGRTTPGPIVTHAKGGESWHNFGRAFDAVPLRLDGSGRIWWDAPYGVWLKLGQIGEVIGLTWGGRWPHPKTDIDHWELTDGLTLQEAQAQYAAQNSTSTNTIG